MNQERFEILMVKVVDGAATPLEKEELMAHVADKPELARELESHQALKAVTDGWVDRLMADLAEDRQQRSVLNRLLVTVGVVLLLASSALPIGWGMFELFLDPQAPLLVKAAVGGTCIGTLSLLVAVIKWRMSTYKHDPYKEVKR